MSDMMRTITPKSDQLNADDLVGGHTITITINRAEVKESGEQKVILGYAGDNGKPYKPGKAMCHVLINVWGKSSKEYIGRSLTLYRDEKIKFGPDTVGGIRISHMSHINEQRTVIIPVSKGIRKPFTVKPLIMGAASTVTDTTADRGALGSNITAPAIPLEDWINDIDTAPNAAGLEHKFKAAFRQHGNDPDSVKKLTEAKDKRKTELLAESMPAEEKP